MQKELNLQCPYKVFADQSASAYHFTTLNGIEYKILFIEATNSFVGTCAQGKVTDVYSSVLENTGNKHTPLDAQVQETIEAVFSLFFKNNNNVLIYICDASDGREHVRYRKFNQWYSASQLSLDIVKKDEIISGADEGQKHYTSLLYHKNHPKRKVIEEAQKEIADALAK